MNKLFPFVIFIFFLSISLVSGQLEIQREGINFFPSDPISGVSIQIPPTPQADLNVNGSIFSNFSTFAEIWITDEGNLDNVVDITYDMISAGDVNALGFTGTFNFLTGVVGGLAMDGDPWFFSGTDVEFDEDVEINKDLFVNRNLEVYGTESVFNQSLLITGDSPIAADSDAFLWLRAEVNHDACINLTESEVAGISLCYDGSGSGIFEIRNFRDGNLYMSIDNRDTGNITFFNDTNFVTVNIENLSVTNNLIVDGNITADTYFGDWSGGNVDGDININSNEIHNLAGLNLTNDINLKTFNWLVPTPTLPNHTANKDYVDDATSSTAFDFFFSNSTSDITGHFNMTETDLERSENTLDSDALGTGTISIFNWTTLVGQPEFNELRQGVYDVHVHLETDGPGKKPVIITPKLYNISADGSERNLLVTFETTNLLLSVGTEYDLHGVLTDPIMLADGERLNLELEAEVGAGGGDVTVTITMEGTTDSHLSVQTSSNAFEKIFIRRDGTNTLVGDWQVDSVANPFNINMSGSFTTTGIGTVDELVVTSGSMTSTTGTMNLGMTDIATGGTILGNQKVTSQVFEITGGVYSLAEAEFSFLDGQDQNVDSGSSPTFVAISGDGSALTGISTFNATYDGIINWTDGASATEDFNTTGDAIANSFISNTIPTDHIDNGDFATGDFTDWVDSGALWDASNFNATWVSSTDTSATLVSDFVPTIGVLYVVIFDFDDFSSIGQTGVSFAGKVLDNELPDGLAQTFVVRATTTDKLTFTVGRPGFGTYTANIDNVIVYTSDSGGKFEATGLIDTTYGNGQISSDFLLLDVGTLDYTGTFGFDIIPTKDSTYNLGNTSNRYDDAHIDEVNTATVNSLVAGTNIQLTGGNLQFFVGAFNGFAISSTVAPKRVSVNNGRDNFDFNVFSDTVGQTLLNVDVSTDTINIDGNLSLITDGNKLFFGNAKDSFDYWDGTNRIMNTTTGFLEIRNNTGLGKVRALEFITSTPEFSLSSSSNLDNLKDPTLITRDGKTEEEFHNLFPDAVKSYVTVKDPENCWQEEYDKWCDGIECLEKDPKNATWVRQTREECGTKQESVIGLGDGYLDNYNLIYQLREENNLMKASLCKLGETMWC